MFVAIIRIILGFIAAVLVAGVVQVLFVAGGDFLRGGATGNHLQSLGLLTLLAATQSAVFSAPFALLAALFAGWLGIRSILFFAAAGIGIALAGFFAQYVGEAGPETILNRYALSAYVASGLAAGLAYWYVAVPKKRPAIA
ncbi:hypothetical protein [Hyphomicrobium sp.]|uniref:hypothetical protein n=1 Tax=Hyphomicrobium sp. TaxID=82 RepID=UPI0025BDBF97|nr:hypothetical protein [Hyphomicrobium sp.]MCC7251629.1 hypothetical protein [Hyphomicrobium sp.]